VALVEWSGDPEHPSRPPSARGVNQRRTGFPGMETPRFLDQNGWDQRWTSPQVP